MALVLQGGSCNTNNEADKGKARAAPDKVPNAEHPYPSSDQAASLNRTVLLTAIL